MYVVSSGSVEWASQGNYQGYSLSLSFLSANTQVVLYHSSGLHVQKTSWSFYSIWKSISSGAVGGGRWEAFLRPQEDDQICISQLNY